MVDAKALDKILQDTLVAIEASQEQIYDIFETAHSESESIEQELIKTKKDTIKIIDQVDFWEKEEKKARKHLMHVSKNFNRFSEKDVKDAYDNAYKIQLKVQLLREEEKAHKKRRTDLEIRYKNIKKTVEKAEKLISQVGVALKYLSCNLENIWEQVDQQNQSLGLAIIMAQEEERRRIARGLHDGPAQQLANIVLRAEYCQKLLDSKPQKLDTELGELKTFARSTLGEIRKILFDLRPLDLENLELTKAIENLIKNFTKTTEIKTDFRAVGTGEKHTIGYEVAIFRTIQEALNNIQKHSQAKNVNIFLQITPTILNTVVKDDGCGFDTTEDFGDKHFGLKGMREWVDVLGGKISIDSEKNKGTKIVVSIPTIKG